MAKKPPNPWYFTYQEYDAVKKSLVYEPKETIDVSFANHLINSIHNTPKKEEKLRETFCELKKLVQRDYCFYYHGDNCCNYINYWLNKTVRKSEYNVNDENFNIFDKFMKIDPKAKEDKINCTSKLSYIDTDAFEKIKKLYDLYDYFTELKESKNRSSLCHNISKLSEKYESIWQECKGKDDYLCNKLRNLKRVIENDELVVNDMCTRNNFESFILKIDPPPPKEQNPPKNVQVPVQSRNSGKAHTRPTVSVPSPQAHGTKSVETRTPPPVLASSSHARGRNSLSHAQGLEKQAQTLEKQIQVLEEQVREEGKRTLSAPPEQFPLPLPSLGQLESSETEEPTGPKGLPEPELRLEQPQEHDVYRFREDEEDTFREEVYPSAVSRQPTFNTETIMDRMKIAVSNVFEQVEPTPIIGVSGGMGALFLLFKYTPVGSFFGRRKGRMHRIPNNFGEYFTGFTPGFAEQDYGNFGNEGYHISYRPE
ncbi:VIR protein [Plasmodium vivax]|uniref:VIR protein n=1 Tax=Plasmodium vivax TaxID=5855 RepID=A0A1G4E2R7_PLAVI|nr:VIR protein [Plasmodium vivax]